MQAKGRTVFGRNPSIPFHKPLTLLRLDNQAKLLLRHAVPPVAIIIISDHARARFRAIFPDRTGFSEVRPGPAGSG